MKQIILTVCATLIALLGHGQNAGQEFTMKPMQYSVEDNTPFGFERSGTNGRVSDISVSVVLSVNREKQEEQWLCKYGSNLDTLLIAVNRRDLINGWQKIQSYPNGIAISEYLKDNHGKATADAEKKIAYYTEKINTLREHEPWVDREKVAAEDAAKRELAEQRRFFGDYKTEFTRPIGQIKTKSITNDQGAKVAYEYYVNADGYEVMRGKYSITMNYNRYKFWTGLDKYGWVYLNGNESITYYYRNGILHGKLSYNRDISTTSTFGNAMKLKDSYNFEIYKGFLTGIFKIRV